MRITFFVTLSFVGVYLVAINSAKAIHNGDLVEKNAYPEVVQIVSYYGFGESSQCTGTYIAPHVVLTAAHCLGKMLVMNPDHLQKNIKIKVSNSEQNTFFYTDVTSFKVHPKSQITYPENEVKFHKGILADLALLYTEKTPIDDFNMFPELFQNNSEYEENLVLLGTGKSDLGHEGNLQTGSMRKSSLSSQHPDVLILKKKNSKQVSCLGDSGGPAIIKTSSTYSIVGVISYTQQSLPFYLLNGDKCGKAHKVGVSMISPHINWVKESINEMTSVNNKNN